MSGPLKKAFVLVTGEIHFELADPGTRYQATDIVGSPRLPTRRMIFGGIKGDTCFVYYEHGGFSHSYVVVVFRKTSKASWKFLWGGTGLERANNLVDLRKKIGECRFSDDESYYW